VKKLYSQRAWRDRTRRRLAVEQHRRPNRRRVRQKGGAAEEVLAAPAAFSLIENTADVVRFLQRVEHQILDGGKLRLDFRAVDKLSPDAVALLVAKVRELPTKHGRRVRASRPKNSELRRIWNDSGLTDIFQSTESEELPEPRGKIIMRSMVETNPEAALFLREFAQQHLSLENEADWLSIQTILLEGMANTVNHADGSSGEERHLSGEAWYAAVYCDETTSSAKFTFLDTGVGILESLRKKPPLSERLLMSTTSSHGVLKKVLEGAITSSTGLKHRGEGLPEIRTIAAFDQEVDRLVIVTNDVFADVSASTFTTLPVDFHGTVIYWEKIGRWQKR
jgi:hypothetical protein